MFLDEARIASRIHHHNVVQVFEVGTDGDRPFLVMELVRGRSLNVVLARALARGRELPDGAVLRILADAAEGLHAAHEATDSEGQPLGVVHRDVSPHNLHVSYDGVTKVLDFGIAAARGKLATTRTNEVQGKFAYLAPEQIDRTRVLDRRVDVWALGVVAWEVLARKRLFRGPDEPTTLWNVMNVRVPPLASVRADLPPAVCACVDACLARDPVLRPATMGEVAAVFATEAARSGGGTHAVASLMEALFAEDRLADEQRLVQAVRRAPLVPAEPSNDELAATRLRSPRERRWARLALAVVLLALVAAGSSIGWRWASADLVDSASPAAVDARSAPSRAGAEVETIPPEVTRDVTPTGEPPGGAARPTGSSGDSKGRVRPRRGTSARRGSSPLLGNPY
jgi:serine/threonine-protein kinase